MPTFSPEGTPERSPSSKDRGSREVLTENTDDFIIGDRVWVNGMKPGYIQYIGETQFSSGDWAGVVLDDHTGKNDGSVSGVRYFQCEPKRGVFARLHRLTRFPICTSRKSDSDSMNGSSKNHLSPPSSVRSLTPTRTRPMSPGVFKKMRVGDRVTVNSTSGNRTGVLRYLGTTDFAVGEWAGIELDEPIGKNDGSVAGKRYFSCKMKHGLFAPIHKVTRLSGRSSPFLRQTSSHDSLNSTPSSITSRKISQTVTTTVSSSVLQDALREKEQHIDQLLKERDLERAEVARAAAQVDEAEQQLATMQAEHRRYLVESEMSIGHLRALLEAAERERKQLLDQLEEERKILDDLQFRLEEEEINKSDLQDQAEQEHEHVVELEQQLGAAKAQMKLLINGGSEKDIVDDMAVKHKEEIESLTNKLKNTEAKIKTIEASQRELDRSKHQQQKQVETINDLKQKLESSEKAYSTLKEEMQESCKKLAEKEWQLQVSDQKCDKLMQQKAKLNEELSQQCRSHQEESKTIADLNHTIREKERLIGAVNLEVTKLKAKISQLEKQKSKEKDSAALQHREDIQVLKHQLSTTQQEMDVLREKWHKAADALAEKEELAMEKAAEVRRLTRQCDELESHTKRLSTQLQESHQKLEEADNNNRLEVILRQVQAENELLSSEKEKLLKRCISVEEVNADLERQNSRLTKEKQEQQVAVSDRETQVTLLKHEVDRLQSEFAKHRQELQSKLAETEINAQTMQDMFTQMEYQKKFLEELHCQLQQVEGERDKLANKLHTMEAGTSDRRQMESKMSILQEEVEELKKRQSDSTHERNQLQEKLDASRIQLHQKEQELLKCHQELASLRKESNSGHEESIQIARQDDRHLENKVVQLQVALAQLQASSKITATEYQKVKDERDAMENQVEFLNSVIVDMQKKNDELKGRIDIMETEVLFDGNGLNINLAKNAVNPRPKSNRQNSLPFCDICDGPGHWTSECEQTF